MAASTTVRRLAWWWCCWLVLGHGVGAVEVRGGSAKVCPDRYMLPW